MKSILLFVLFLVVMAPLIIEIKNNHFDILNLKNAFLFYLLLQIGIYESFQSIFEFDQNQIRPSDWYISYAIILTTIGVISFNISYYSIPRISFLAGGIVRPSKIFLFGSTLIVFGYVMFFLLLYINGGLFEFMDNLQSWRTDGVSGQGVYIFPATVGLSIGAIFFSSRFIEKKGYKFQKYKRLRILIMLIVAVIPPIIIGFRGLILAPIFYWLIVFRGVNFFGSGKLKYGVSILGVAGFTAFGLYRQWREVVSDRFNMIDGVRIMFDARPELFFDFLLRSRGTDIVGLTIKKLHETDQFVGFSNSFFEAISVIIPRFLISKPEPMSVRFSEYFFGVKGGVSPTAIGEFYWMGGITGVIVGMGLLGFFAKIMYSYYLSTKHNIINRLTYALVFFPFMLMAEAVQGNLNGIVMICTIYFVLISFLRMRISRP